MLSANFAFSGGCCEDIELKDCYYDVMLLCCYWLIFSGCILRMELLFFMDCAHAYWWLVMILLVVFVVKHVMMLSLLLLLML